MSSVLFIPHGGGPLPLMEDPGHASMNDFLRDFPASLPRPEAIVVISAHWESEVIGITGAAQPPLLFDYYGFPPETYEYRYPAPGHPALAARIAELLAAGGIEARIDDERGLDHGVFVPLMLMYPAADIPCLQVSLSASLDAAEHVRIGRTLAALRSDNILVLGSGFSFHNLKAIFAGGASGDDAANLAFEAWLAETCSGSGIDEAERERRLVEWEQAPHARYCHPREEHLLPLQVCYGIAGGPARTVFQDAIGGFVASAYLWD